MYTNLITFSRPNGIGCGQFKSAFTVSETIKKWDVSNCITPLDESWDSGADVTMAIFVTLTLFSNFSFQRLITCFFCWQSSTMGMRSNVVMTRVWGQYRRARFCGPLEHNIDCKRRTRWQPFSMMSQLLSISRSYDLTSVISSVFKNEWRIMFLTFDPDDGILRCYGQSFHGTNFFTSSFCLILILINEC